tara:strand:- start:2768 stop:3274 length:507 start_codon:yes stop_codon:yes gene_type:complete
MVALKDLKRKALRHQQKHGVPPFVQRRNEKFGTFNKVRRLPKVIRYTPPPITPRKRFQKAIKKVMAQNKTSKWREETRHITLKKPEQIQQVKMPFQHFPVHPGFRKGSNKTDFRLTLSERIGLINSGEWTYNTGIADLDLDNDNDCEFDFDEWSEEEVDLDIDDINYD